MLARYLFLCNIFIRTIMNYRVLINMVNSGFPGDSVVKILPASSGDEGSVPGLGRSSREGNANTPVFLPGKSHRQRRLAGHSPWGLQKSWMWLSNYTTTTTWSVLFLSILPPVQFYISIMFSPNLLIWVVGSGRASFLGSRDQRKKEIFIFHEEVGKSNAVVAAGNSPGCWVRTLRWRQRRLMSEVWPERENTH